MDDQAAALTSADASDRTCSDHFSNAAFTSAA